MDTLSMVPYTIKRIRYFGVNHVVDVNPSGRASRISLGDSKKFRIEKRRVLFVHSTYLHTTFSSRGIGNSETTTIIRDVRGVLTSQ